MIKFDAVSVRVAGALPATPARDLITDINVTISEKIVALIGANGSGKSTLLQLINGLTKPTSGTVSAPDRVGFVFTDPSVQLLMPTVIEDIMLSLRQLPRSERRAAAFQTLRSLGLEDLATRSVYELSAGQQQLVAIATVMATDPEVLVLDEPTTLLDLRNTELVSRMLKQLAERGVQILIATHDLELAATTDRILLIADGKIAADGNPETVISSYRKLSQSG
ncbi:energy-coupling factor ABC transporter ATP-binding protein [Canibacter zhoujuaniae]|uniref:energy-coupling factor ABC transporter ATP-binding protein n=1 Tax=Canibacter zhoujuaniae TaxID=2708343 RepID=UPI00141EBCA9|nr:ABC transporter ATP-binding protein [Canibacter zhoujuaniae]